MATRYDNATTKITTVNGNETINELLENRDLLSIEHYRTLTINKLSTEQIKSLVIKQHFWSFGDRYWKLSSLYYGTPKYWWIIAWFNQKPIESMLNLGDKVYIPTPLASILRYYNA